MLGYARDENVLASLVIPNFIEYLLIDTMVNQTVIFPFLFACNPRLC